MDKNEGEYKYGNIHKILAHSYAMYFVLFLIGIMLDIFLDINFFNASFMAPLGIAALIFGSILILWAQYTSRNLNKQNISKETFCKGPYCYTRNPTHWGLFFLMLGFGIITNSFFVVIFTLLAFIISRFTFLEKQEKILAEKYGVHYLEYKKSVKL